MKNFYAIFLCALLSTCTGLAPIAPAYAVDDAPAVEAVPAVPGASAYRMYALVIGIDNRPPIVMPGKTIFTSKDECEAALPEALVGLQKFFDMSVDPNIRGVLAVADGKCLSDADIAPKA